MESATAGGGSSGSRGPNGPAGRALVASVLLLVLLGAMFHGPRLNKPFGVADTNAGMYFGLFVKTWEDFGFWNLRGIPLGAQRLVSPDVNSYPYLNHPPGIFWMHALLGADEGRMRLPTVIAAVAAAVGLLLLLRRVVGHLAALLAAVCLLGLPSQTIYSQVSYEIIVLAHGLWLWLATLRVHETEGSARARWRAVQVLVAFTGPWSDWSFGFFCLGLVPLVASKSPGTMIRRLWVPALVSGLATASVVAWRAWASQCPLIAGAKVDTSLQEMLQTTILTRPEFVDYVTLSARTMVAVTTLPLALAAVVGVVLLCRQAPRLTIALLVGGLSQPLVFANHATDHVHFYCYTSALFAASAGALGALRSTGLRRAGLVVLAALGACAWATSFEVTRNSDTTFYRDLGRTLTEATRDVDTAGAVTREYAVGSNFPSPYPYYVESPAVVAGDLTKLLGSASQVMHVLRTQRRKPREPAGFRYLWFKEAGGGSAPSFFDSTKRELAAFLGPFPKERVPSLERRLAEPGIGLDLDLREVFLVHVPPAFSVGVVHAPQRAARAQNLATALRMGEGQRLPVPFERAAAVPIAELAQRLGDLTHVVVLWTSELDADASVAEDARTAADLLRASRHPVVGLRGDRGVKALDLSARGDFASVDGADEPAAEVASAVAAAFARLASQ